MKKDSVSNIEVPTKSLDVVARTAAADGVSVDLKGFHSCIALLDVDAFIDGIITGRLEESADDSTFTVVAAADIIFTEAGAINASGQIVIDGAADDDQAFKLGYNGNKRYLRWSLTESGTTSGSIVGGLLIPGDKRAGGKIVS